MRVRVCLEFSGSEKNEMGYGGCCRMPVHGGAMSEMKGSWLAKGDCEGADCIGCTEWERQL